jgi:hypothetical protein
MIPNVFLNLKPKFREELGVSHFRMGKNCRVLIITGENAGGKSFIRRIFQAFLGNRRKPISSYSFSMEARSRSASDGNIFLTLAYGDEGYAATSANTVRSIRTILDTSDKGEKMHIIIIDEPEIGLSEETELAVGRMISERLSDEWPDNRVGVVVMTHSKHIVRELMGLPGSKFLNLFNRYPTADAWLGREIVTTDLDAFCDDSLEKFRRIREMLSKKAAKNDDDGR